MSFSQEVLQKLVCSLDRPSLLKALGIPIYSRPVGDSEGVRALDVNLVSGLTSHRQYALFFDEGPSTCCSGARLCRHNRSTVAIPCFAQLKDGEAYCMHCAELWAETGEEGYVELNKTKMPYAFSQYELGKRGSLWRDPVVLNAEELFSDTICDLRQVFEGTAGELPTDWPGESFKEVASSILISSGVLHADADRSSKLYRRSKSELKGIGKYLSAMVHDYLRVRAMCPLDVFRDRMRELHRTAKSVGKAAVWALQAERPHDPVLTGPVVAADVMMAAMANACDVFDTYVENCSDGTATDKYVLQWGEKVERFKRWAASVAEQPRPKLVPIRGPKPASGTAADAAVAGQKSPAPTPTPTRNTRVSPEQHSYYAVAVGREPGIYKSAAEARAQTDGFPGNVFMRCRSKQAAEEFMQKHKKNEHDVSAAENRGRVWYAAKDTQRPGIYAHRQVAEAYNRDGSGTIITCATMAQARAAVGLPSVRCYYESAVAEPASTADEASATRTQPEIYGVRGGTENGVYYALSEALAAVVDGGGEYAPFSSDSAAQRFARSRTAEDPNYYVVWVGRMLGVMSAELCIESTQNVPNAKMQGPMGVEEAYRLWVAMEPESKRIGGGVNDGYHTPNKPQRPRWYYGVAIGRIPGVYLTWQEAHKQIRGIKRNLHQKFRTRVQAEQFVRKHRVAGSAAPKASQKVTRRLRP